ncbi:MAG: hypothetical protein IJE18_00470 [Bacteroidaceae bacterium]|nr:hypothetical protein [Bacteroidaceae bacterium]
MIEEIVYQFEFIIYLTGIYINNIFNERSYSSGMMGATSPLYFIDSPRNFFFDVRVRF